MNQAHEADYQRRVEPVDSTFLPGTSIEIIRDARPLHPPRHALFDFDGTLSLVREGWPEVMVPMMVEVLAETGTDEPAAELDRLCRSFVMELTGKQTIYQMIRLAEEVRRRGGDPHEPVVYKHRYHELLMGRISNRREQLRSRSVDPASMLVPGATAVLEGLQRRGVNLYLASGTDETYVRDEAELLGVDHFFGSRIHGAVDDYRSFSKQQVIERIMQENRVDGESLVGFGDGYVEIDNVKSSGGIAVAVASDESGRSGKPDAWKRERLLGVGDDVIVPDFSEADQLLAWLWREPGGEDAV